MLPRRETERCEKDFSTLALRVNNSKEIRSRRKARFTMRMRYRPANYLASPSELHTGQSRDGHCWLACCWADSRLPPGGKLIQVAAKHIALYTGIDKRTSGFTTR